MFLLDPRKASTHAMIPLAMLIGIAVASAILPLSAPGGRESPAVRLRVGLQGVWALAAVIALLAYGSVAAIDTSSVDSSPLHPLSEESRQAISWVARNTPEDGRFLVIKAPAVLDSFSPVVPASQRANLGAVRGYGGWAEPCGASRAVDELQACAGAPSCGEVGAKEDTSFSHVYVASRPPATDTARSRRSCGRRRYVVLPMARATIFGRGFLDG
jgi:hypothetical protein